MRIIIKLMCTSSFIFLKTLFFAADLASLIYYLKLIKSHGELIYFTLTLFFGTCCMLTSCINILTINTLQHDYLTLTSTFNYIGLRSYIFIIEWAQYLLFLKLLVNKKFIILIITMLLSTLVIHAHYLFIEYLEENILNVSQYVSPFHIVWCIFYSSFFSA